MVGPHRAGVAGVAEVVEAQARLPIAPDQILDVGGGQIAHDSKAVRAQGAAEDRADAGQDVDRTGGQQGLGLCSADDREAARLVQFRRDLGQEAVGGQADGDGQASLLLDPFLQPDQLEGGRAAVEAFRARQVDPGLVQRQGLDQGRQLADRAEDALALDYVFAEVGLDDDRVGTGLQRLVHGHGRADAVQAGDVAGGRDHAALAAADDDRLVAQFRSVAFLDRGVEGVAVEMGDGQIAEFIMGDHPTRGAGRTSLDLAVAGPQAVAAGGLQAQNELRFLSFIST
ncbi:hypothetical protein D3C80_1275660 [compost metagenome]